MPSLNKTTFEMQKKLDKPISITKPAAEFNTFLDRPFNSRIIFSGIFGSGKTFFLKDFFKSHSDYIALHLYPTNYTVAKSEDVFELIKFDILYELLKSKPRLEKLKLSYLSAFPLVQKDISITHFTSLLEFIPKIGKPLSSIVEAIVNVNKIVKEKISKVSTDDHGKIEV